MAENYQELNRLFANRGIQRNPNAASSIANLFNGNAAAQQQASYLGGAKNGAQLADIMAQARQRQLAGVARESLAKQAEEAGNMRLANLFRAGTTAEDMAKAAETDQRTTQRGKMFSEAAEPGNLERINREVLSQANSPVSLASVEGGSIVDRFKTADHQNFAPTQVGQAEIGERGAQSVAALARAGESNAQAARARAGIGVDKAGNYEIKEGADGTMYRVPKVGNAEATPITTGGAPLKGNIAEKFGERLPEGILNHALASDGGTTPDPQMMERYLARKQQLGPRASDADVIASLRQDTNDAATDPGPPTDLARHFGFFGEPSSNALPENQQGASTQNFSGPNATMPSSGTNIFQNGAPHPEGTKLRGADGKLYIVQNGQPVLAPQ